MRYLILLIAFILSGCGDDNKPSIEWSGNITEQSERFVLSYDENVINGPIIRSIENLWITIQACANSYIDISSMPLTIEYMPSSDIPEGDRGRLVLEDSFAAIRDTDLDYYMGKTTAHEMIHYLIEVSGGDRESNSNHTHEYFQLCEHLIF